MKTINENAIEELITMLEKNCGSITLKSINFFKPYNSYSYELFDDVENIEKIENLLGNLSISQIDFIKKAYEL